MDQNQTSLIVLVNLFSVKNQTLRKIIDLVEKVDGFWT